MKKSATIFVKGVQSVDGESDVIELTSEGTVEIKDNGLRLSYFEQSEHSEHAHTVVTLIGETVKIDREGADEMSMIIQRGRRRGCSYASPMGPLLIGTYGTALSHADGKLSLAYDLDMNSVLMSKNELEITYIFDKE